MRLNILGPRILVRNYSLPEQIGSIIVPESVRTQYDGRVFEVVCVGAEVSKRLAVGGTRGEELYPILSHGEGLPELHLQPDDIIMLRHMFRGAYAGPEVERHYGCPCYFLSVVEQKAKRGSANELEDVCIVEKVIPAISWKEESLDGQAAA